jgi:hypothetical protein
MLRPRFAPPPENQGGVTHSGGEARYLLRLRGGGSEEVLSPEKLPEKFPSHVRIPVESPPDF